VSTSTSVIEQATTRALPQPLTSICAGLILVGLAAFGYGIATDPQTAWLSFHANFLYYAILSQGGLVLACIFVIVGARWPGPIRRMAEGLGAWVPISLVLGCVGYFGRNFLFEWQRVGAVHGKEAWLNETRFYATDLGILAVLALLSVAFLRASVRPTLKPLADGGTGFARSMAQRWTANWRGDAEERAASLAATNRLAPAICLLFAIGYTFLVFDQVMSMEQTWFSNLFGAYVSWGGILGGVAWCCIVALLYRNAPGFEGQITEARLHDLGKMLFAFSIFWMYLFFAQYLVIYYGGLPEETQFYYDRLGSQFLIDKGFTELAWQRAWLDWDWKWTRLAHAYGWASMAAWLLNWVIPFWVLLGAKPKKTPWILGPVAGLLLLGFWIERNLLVWPSVIKEGHGGLAILGPIQLGIAAGFLGAFVLVYLVYTRVFPGLAAPAPAEPS
jgi:hypothetical protein